MEDTTFALKEVQTEHQIRDLQNRDFGASPLCDISLQGVNHIKNHAATVHNVFLSK